MRSYLATLHKRSDTHKKRFALAASGGFTLLIFGIWSMVNFGSASMPASGTAASVNKAVEEANPFGSLLRGVGTSFKAMMGELDEFKQGLEAVNFEQGYENMRDNTLKDYAE